MLTAALLKIRALSLHHIDLSAANTCALQVNALVQIRIIDALTVKIALRRSAIF